MKMKNYFFLLAILLVFPLSIISCSDDDDDTPNPPQESSSLSAYILNAGSMGTAPGTLDIYDLTAKELNENVFKAINGRELGDTANDMLIYGSKIYIAVTGSSTIEVLDLSGKSIKQIKMEDADNKPQGPRYFSSNKGKVYVSTQDGFLSQLDTTSLTVEQRVKVGLGIEQQCIVDDLLYATTYGSYPDYDNKVISVSLPEFVVKDTIEVTVNPTMIEADEQGMLYVLSNGDYNKIKQTLQRVNPKTKEVTNLITNDELSMTMQGDYLYVIGGTVDENYIKTSTNYKKYNLKTGAFETKEFVNSGISIENAKNAFANPVSEEIYVTAGNYQNTGNVYIISKEGELVKEVPLSGINPMCVRFLQTKK